MAVRLRVTSDQAAQLLQVLDDEPTTPAPTVNGRRTEASA